MNDIALTLIKNDNEIFLVKRRFKPFENYWSFPGGRRESNESIEIAAVREAKEETDLDIEIIRMLDNFVGRGDNNRTANLYIFLCKARSQDYFVDKEECLEGGWFDINKVYQGMQLIPVLKKYLQENAIMD